MPRPDSVSLKIVISLLVSIIIDFGNWSDAVRAVRLSLRIRIRRVFAVAAAALGPSLGFFLRWQVFVIYAVARSAA